MSRTRCFSTNKLAAMGAGRKHCICDSLLDDEISQVLCEPERLQDILLMKFKRRACSFATN